MIPLSEKFKFYFMLCASIIFVLSGVGMLITGIYRSVTASKELQTGLGGNEIDGTSGIITGLVELFVGGLGLATVFLKKRILLMVYTGVLAASIIGNVVGIAIVVIKGRATGDQWSTNMQKAIVHSYGNYTTNENRLLSAAIDQHQNEEDCCGWSGADAEGNLFKDSQFYLTQGNKPTRTLPDSCCKIVGPECREAQDLKEARKKGFVRKEDCLDKLIFEVNVFLWLSLIQLIFNILLQGASCAIGTICIIENTLPSLE